MYQGSLIMLPCESMVSKRRVDRPHHVGYADELNVVHIKKRRRARQLLQVEGRAVICDILAGQIVQVGSV